MANNRQKFVELAEKRTTKAIKTLRLVGNLSNRSNYSYTDEDSVKILRALERELRDLRSRFNNGDGSNEITFKL